MRSLPLPWKPEEKKKGRMRPEPKVPHSQNTQRLRGPNRTKNTMAIESTVKYYAVVFLLHPHMHFFDSNTVFSLGFGAPKLPKITRNCLKSLEKFPSKLPGNCLKGWVFVCTPKQRRQCFFFERKNSCKTQENGACAGLSRCESRFTTRSQFTMLREK